VTICRTPIAAAASTAHAGALVAGASATATNGAILVAIAPDAYDPSGTMVSIGDWAGDARQFGIRGVYANPADVSTATGVVKYELSQPNWVVASTGARWGRTRRSS